MTQFQRLTIALDQIEADQIALTADQQHYLQRVLRLQTGDRFIAIDGQGHWWLSAIAPDRTAQILESIEVQTELPIGLTLLMAMPKNGMDDIVRQATELGVSAIAPILSERTLLQPSSQKLDRWRRIAQEAAEQSERQIIPQIFEPIAFRDALPQFNSGQRFIGVTRSNASHLQRCLTAPLDDSIVMAIGPEGGWSEAEVAMAIAAGFQPVSLGKRILRAVTAAIAALTMIVSVCEA
ncbi:MAG: 16S rRNA (uracil(1498)-N(3))-methyltransferase [Microcoleus sp. SIO2G3]|nr:16S rRNA (uracil(1498)-N(3))-methyltransferase [Microcoleus sp. SIO2G3]